MKKTSFLMAIVIVLSFVFTGCSNHSQADDILSMETLNGNTYNLVDAVYEKGAHFVLGTTETMVIDSDNKFLDSFMNKLNEGGTIEEAYNHAKKQGPFKIVNENDIPETITDFPLYFVGTGKQYLN